MDCRDIISLENTQNLMQAFKCSEFNERKSLYIEKNDLATKLHSQARQRHFGISACKKEPFMFSNRV